MHVPKPQQSSISIYSLKRKGLVTGDGPQNYEQLLLKAKNHMNSIFASFNKKSCNNVSTSQMPLSANPMPNEINMNPSISQNYLRTFYRIGIVKKTLHTPCFKT